mgnify:FL=1
MKLLHIFSLYLVFSAISSSKIIYVDSEAVSTGDGSLNNPYRDINTAISSLLDVQSKLIDPDSRLILSLRSTAYTLTSLEIIGPLSGSIEITTSSMPTSLKAQNFPCSTLPTVVVSTSVTLTTLSVVQFTGLKISLQGSSDWTLKNIASFDVSSSCFDLSGRLNTTSIPIQTELISQMKIFDTSILTGTNIQFVKINNTNLTVADSELVFTEAQNAKSGYMISGILGSENSLQLKNCLLRTNGSSLFNLPRLLNVRDGLNFWLENFSMTNFSSVVHEQMIVATNFSLIALDGINFDNVSLNYVDQSGFETEASSLIQFSEFMAIILNNITLARVNLSQSEQAPLISLIGISSCLNNCTSYNGSMELTNLHLVNSTCALSVINYRGINQTVLWSNVTVTRTTFGQNPFNFSTTYPITGPSSEISTLYPQQVFQVANFSFQEVTCLGSVRLLTFEVDTQEGLYSFKEPFQIMMQNMSLIESSFSVAPHKNSYNIIPGGIVTSNGFFLNVSSFNSINNKYHYPVFMNDNYFTSLILRNSSFIGDTYNSTTLFSAKAKISSGFTMFFSQYISNTSFSPVFYRLIYLSNSSFANCIFTNSIVLSSNYPIVIVTSNNWTNCSFAPDPNSILKSPAFDIETFDLQTLTYFTTSSFIHDPQIQSATLNNDLELLGALDLTWDTASAYNFSSVLFLSVCNNILDSLSLNNTNFYQIMNYNRKEAVTNFASNTVSNSRIYCNDFSWFIGAYSIENLLFSSNNFTNLQGDCKILGFEQLSAETAVVVDQTNIFNMSGISFLFFESTQVGRIFIHRTNATVIEINDGFIELSRLYLKSSCHMDTFLIDRVNINTNAGILGIFSINIIEDISEQGKNSAISVAIQNIQVTNVQFSSPNMDDLPSSGILLLLKSFCPINITNIYLGNVKTDFSHSIASFSSNFINIQNLTAINVLSQVNVAVIDLTAVNVTINNSYFFNVSAPYSTSGGLLNIGFKGYSQLQELIVTNTFIQESVGYFGSVFYIMSGLFNIFMDNCTFINNPGTDRGVIYMNEVTASSFLVSRVSVTMTSLALSGSWFYMKEVVGLFLFTNITVTVQSKVPGSLIQVTSSPYANITVQDITITSLNYTTPQLTEELKLPTASSIASEEINKFSFATLDSGNFTLMRGSFSRFNLLGTSLIQAMQGAYVPVVELRDSYFSEIVVTRLDGKAYFPMIFVASTAPITSTVSVGALTLLISNCSFDNIYSEQMGMIAVTNYFQTSASISIDNSTFGELYGLNGSALTLLSPDSKSTLCLVNSCIFQKNVAALFGGAIYSYGANLTVKNTRFTENLALIQGAAVYYEEPKSNFSDLLGNNNTFEGNADFDAINRTASSPPIGLKVEFDPQNIAANKLVLKQTSSGYFIGNATSESLQNLMVTTYLYTASGDIIPDPSREIAVSVTANNNRGSSMYTSQAGCTYQKCVLTNITLDLSGPTGFNVTVNVSYLSNLYNLSTSFIMSLRPCVPGEIYVSSFEICQVCPAGKYSFNPQDSNCQMCKPGTNCLGGSEIELYPGYWRESTQSEVIYSCNDNNGQRCLGGYETNCTAGFTGQLCLQCDYKNGYLPGSRLGICQVCTASYSVIIKGILMFLYTVPYQFFVISVIMDSNTHYIEAIIRKTTKYLPDTSPYVNLLTTYSQIITIVLSVSTVLQDRLSVFAVVGNPIEAAFLSLECLLFNQFEVPFEYLVYYRIIIFSLSPFVKWLIFVGLYSLLCGFNLDFVRRMKIVCGLVTLVLIEQPGIINELFHFLRCKDFGTGGLFMSVRPNYSCETEGYLSFRNNVVYGLIGFWVVFIPFLFWIFLFRNRKDLDKERIRYIFGGFFNEYQNKMYFWGVFLIYFKVGLLLINNFVDDTKRRALSSFAFLFCFKLFTDYMQPFKSDYLTRAQKIALLAYSGSVILAFYADDNPYPILYYLSLTLLIILNGVAIAYILFVLFIMYKIKHGEMVVSLFRALRRCDWKSIKEEVLGIKEKPTSQEVKKQLKKTTLQAPLSAQGIDLNLANEEDLKRVARDKPQEGSEKVRRQGILAARLNQIESTVLNLSEGIMQDAASQNKLGSESQKTPQVQSIEKRKLQKQKEKERKTPKVEVHIFEESKETNQTSLTSEEIVLKEFELLTSQLNQSQNSQIENNL